MKLILRILGCAVILFSITNCSSTKNTTGIKTTRGNLDGRWTLSDINVDVPANYHVTNIFDEAPYPEFKGSTWNLVRNGKGSFTLTNGTKKDIYWSIYGKGDSTQFQFKKLNGMKPKNVENGYRLYLLNITSNSFTARSSVDIGDMSKGYITYTFTK